MNHGLITADKAAGGVPRLVQFLILGVCPETAFDLEASNARLHAAHPDGFPVWVEFASVDVSGIGRHCGGVHFRIRPESIGQMTAAGFSNVSDGRVNAATLLCEHMGHIIE